MARVCVPSRQTESHTRTPACMSHSEVQLGYAYALSAGLGMGVTALFGLRKSTATSIFPLYFVSLLMSIVGWLATLLLEDAGPVALLVTPILIGLSESGTIFETQLMAELKEDDPEHIALIQGTLTAPALRLQYTMEATGGVMSFVGVAFLCEDLDTCSPEPAHTYRHALCPSFTVSHIGAVLTVVGPTRSLACRRCGWNRRGELRDAWGPGDRRPATLRLRSPQARALEI